MKNAKALEECIDAIQLTRKKCYDLLYKIMTKNFSYKHLEKEIRSQPPDRYHQMIIICNEGFKHNNKSERFLQAKEKFKLDFNEDIYRVAGLKPEITKIPIKPEKEKEFLEDLKEISEKDYFGEIPVLTANDTIPPDKTKKTSLRILVEKILMIFELKSSVETIINFLKKR